MAPNFSRESITERWWRLISAIKTQDTMNNATSSNNHNQPKRK